MGCDYRSDLGYELGLSAEQLGETLCEPLRLPVRIGVLHEPPVGADRAPWSHKLDQPLDPAPLGAHANAPVPTS